MHKSGLVSLKETHDDYVKPVSYTSHNDNRITSDGKNYAALANDVVSALGGKENIVAVTHCMTRLRFVLKDESLTDTARLKSISGVLGVVRNDNQCGVIGNTVSRIP